MKSRFGLLMSSVALSFFLTGISSNIHGPANA